MLRSVTAGLALVLSGCVVAVASTGVDPHRLTRDIVPVHQSIRLELDADRPDYTGSVEVTLQNLIRHGIGLNSLRVRNPTLEDLFLKLTGHRLRE